MKVLLGPIQKTEDQQQNSVDSESKQRASSSTKQRRGSIARGRSLSLSEDEGRAAPQEEVSDAMGLQGARVHLPVITEDDQDPESLEVPGDRAPYTPMDRKLILPSLFARAQMGSRRHSGANVQLEIAGSDLQLPPSKSPLLEQVVQPRRADWQGKSRGLHMTEDLHWLKEEYPDDVIAEEPLRQILQCHSIGIPMKIMKQDYRPGRYATPLFHCRRCLDLFEKIGKIPKDCSEPTQLISGPEILISTEAFKYIKNIWGRHLAMRLGKQTGKYSEASEIKNLLKDAMKVDFSGHTLTGSESETTDSSDLTSVTDLSSGSSARKSASYQKEGIQRQGINGDVSKKHKKHRRRRRKSIAKVSHEGINLSHGHLRKKRHKKKKKRHSEEGEDSEVLTGSEEEIEMDDSHHRHDVLTKGGSKKHHKKKRRSICGKTRRRKTEHEEGEDSEVLTGSEEEIEMDDSHHRHDVLTKGGSKKHHKKKRRSICGKTRRRKTEHGDEAGDSEELVFSEDESFHEDSLHDTQDTSRRQHRRKKHRSKAKKRGKHVEYEGDGIGEDDESESLTEGSIHDGSEGKEAESSEALTVSEGENLEEEDSMHKTKDARGKKHKKKQRSKARKDTKERKHGKEEVEGSEALTVSEDESLGETKDAHRRKQKKKQPRAWKGIRERKYDDAEGSEALTVSEDESLDGKDPIYKTKDAQRRKKKKQSQTGKYTKNRDDAEGSEALTVSEDESLDKEHSMHKTKGAHKGKQTGKKRSTAAKDIKGRKPKREVEADSESQSLSEGSIQDGSEGNIKKHKARPGHRQKKRRSKKQPKESGEAPSVRPEDQGSDSDVFILPGRYDDEDLDGGSSYDELLSRLIDDYENQNQPTNNEAITKTPSSQNGRQFDHSTQEPSLSQNNMYSQASHHTLSERRLSTSPAYPKDAYNKHARQQSQSSNIVLNKSLTGPSSDSARRRKSKAVIRNPMVKTKTGKPDTEKGQLKGNIFQSGASESDAKRRQSVVEQPSSNDYIRSSETEMSSSQHTGRRSSVSQHIIQAGRRSSKTWNTPSQQVLDSSLVDSSGPSQPTLGQSLPQKPGSRTRKMSLKAPIGKARRVSDAAHHSTEINTQKPSDNRKDPLPQRTASNILSSWASSDADLPNFRFNTGQAPGSTIDGANIGDGSTTEGAVTVKMTAPPLPTLPPRSVPEPATDAFGRPVAEVKPNVVEKDRSGSTTPAVTSSSSTSSRESFEDSLVELEYQSQRRDALILPDFGGLSALSFTPAFTFSFYPRLVVQKASTQPSKPSPAIKTSTKKGQGKKTNKAVQKVAGERMSRDTAIKPKTDVTRMAKKMQHRVDNPKPIAKFVKKPLPEKKRPRRKLMHKVASPYQHSPQSGTRLEKKPKKSMTVEPSLVSGSGLRLEPSRTSGSTAKIKTSVTESQMSKLHPSKASNSVVKMRKMSRSNNNVMKTQSKNSGFNIDENADSLQEVESVVIKVTDYI